MQQNELFNSHTENPTYYPAGPLSAVRDTIVVDPIMSDYIWRFVEGQYSVTRDKVPVDDLSIDVTSGKVRIGQHEFQIGTSHTVIGGNEINHVGTYGPLHRIYGQEPPRGTMLLSHQLMEDDDLVHLLRGINIDPIYSPQNARVSLHLPINGRVKILSYTPNYPLDVEILIDQSKTLFISGVSAAWYPKFLEAVSSEGWERAIYWSPAGRDLLGISTGTINAKVLEDFLKVSSLSSMNQDEAQIIEKIVSKELRHIVPRGIVTDGAGDVLYWEEGTIKKANPISTQIFGTDVEQIWGAPYVRNTTGCGDSFFGTVRFVWEQTGDLDAAVRAGSYIASIILGSKNSNLMSVPADNYGLIQQGVEEVL